jgi:hypothetical protein
MDAIALSALEAALVKGDIAAALARLRNWLTTAGRGDPESLLRRTSAAVRPKLVLLMRDVLSRYPSTLVGAPVLLFAQPESTPGKTQPPCLKLPFPVPGANQPCSDLHFLGWLPVGTHLPVEQPFRPEKHNIEVPWFKATSVVAVFRSHPEVFDLDAIELPNMWWGDLFRRVDASIQMAARMLLPYPDALEVAGLMQAIANEETPPERGFFLSDSIWHWAHSEAVLFHETCRHLYSNDI